MALTRDVSKINTKHPQYNKPQTPRQQFAARVNWLAFQTKAARGNIIQAGRVMGEAAKSVQSDLNKVKYSEILFAHIDAVKALEVLEKKIKALKE